MDQILAREPKMAISGPFPGIFRRKIRPPLDPTQAPLSHRESRKGGGGLGGGGGGPGSVKGVQWYGEGKEGGRLVIFYWGGYRTLIF